jgi:iron complex outermembrane receptor protein
MHIGGLTFKYSTFKWFVQLSAQWQEALNNFPYLNNSGIETKMPNSALGSQAIMLELGKALNKNTILGAKMWYQKYNREIPPALFENASSKTQTDVSLRTLITIDKIEGPNKLYTKFSIYKDDIDYNDPTVLVHNLATTYQYYQEIGWDHNMGKSGRFIIFSPLQSSWMENAGPSSGKNQTKVALAGSYDLKLLKQKLDVALNAREELIDNNNILLPGAGLSYILNKYLLLRAGLQKTYRVPSLNELYYFPGGNTSLKPEQGWSEDGGYNVNLKLGKWKISHDLAIYNRNIHDWISWLGGAIWTPHNIAQVHSRGIETENHFEYVWGKYTLHMGCNTAYVLATTVGSYLPNDGSIGKQIPYTPRYNGQLNLGLSYKGLWVNYNHGYTGYRNTVNDGSEYLTPYQTGNLQVMYGCKPNGHELQLNAQCNNLWNQHYMVAAYRPMPGTNGLTGVKLSI